MSIGDLFKKKNSHNTTVSDKGSSNAAYYKLSKQTQEHLKNGQLGLYRNDLYNMSEVMRKEEKYEGQLQLLITVFYIDTFGYSDLDTYQLAKSQGFKVLPPSPMIAPKVASNIRICSQKLGMTDNDLHTFFSENISEDMLPDSVLTIDECFSLWQMWKQEENPQKINSKGFLEKKTADFIKRRKTNGKGKK